MASNFALTLNVVLSVLTVAGLITVVRAALRLPAGVAGAGSWSEPLDAGLLADDRADLARAA